MSSELGVLVSSRTMASTSTAQNEQSARSSLMKRLLFLLLWPALVLAQSKTGELRLQVTDPAGLGVKSSVVLVSEANQFHQSFVTDDGGALDAERLPFGIYRLEVMCEGFAPVSQSLEIRSAIPRQLTIKLSVAGIRESVT